MLNPAFSPNQVFHMKVQHRRLDSHIRWSEPLSLYYRTGSSPQAGRYINVFSGQGKEVGRIFFDHEMRIRAVEFWQYVRGKGRKKVLNFYQERPIRGTGAIFPYDWPIFPLRIGEALTFTRIISLSGGLTAKRKITQVVEQVMKGEVSREKWAALGEGPLARVQCRNGKGELIFTQYWARGCLLPLYGENPDMRYWLVGK